MIEIYTQNIENTWFAIAVNKQQIITSSFGTNQKTTINNVLCNVPFNLPFQVFHEPTASAKNTLTVLKSVFDGKTVNTNLSLATSHLPAYTKKVLKATSTIPLGYVTSYGSIARAVGGGPRAVGNIMAGNPFAPIVPCHRVVRADFTLGGYGFGLKVKAELLGREKRGFSSSKELEVDGGQLTVFPVEYVLRNFA
ncbi:MAG: MGMT family protein [Candidatus Bathyarchaeota archaeon]|nr:MGMT family protein [Candidatus Bathyarchaeota archaeon]